MRLESTPVKVFLKILFYKKASNSFILSWREIFVHIQIYCCKLVREWFSSICRDDFCVKFVKTIGIRWKERRRQMVYLFALNEELHFWKACVVQNQTFVRCVLRIR